MAMPIAAFISLFHKSEETIRESPRVIASRRSPYAAIPATGCKYCPSHSMVALAALAGFRATKGRLAVGLGCYEQQFAVI